MSTMKIDATGASGFNRIIKDAERFFAVPQHSTATSIRRFLEHYVMTECRHRRLDYLLHLVVLELISLFESNERVYTPASVSNVFKNVSNRFDHSILVKE